jgi:hypothetical protein
VSLKIVFNGTEYDGVEAMPPDVRKEYEIALQTLRKSGGEEILSILQRGGETPIKAVRQRPAPVVEADETTRTPLWRVVMWLAAGAVMAWWLFRRG